MCLQAESFDDAAMFRGAKRPVQKECILLINKVTGVSDINIIMIKFYTIIMFTGSSLGTDKHNCTIEISPVSVMARFVL